MQGSRGDHCHQQALIQAGPYLDHISEGTETLVDILSLSQAITLQGGGMASIAAERVGEAVWQGGQSGLRGSTTTEAPSISWRTGSPVLRTCSASRCRPGRSGAACHGL
jgi:hypothetical protein